MQLVVSDGSFSSDPDMVTLIDVQATVNAVLAAQAGFDSDVNDDGFTNAVDVQQVVNRVLGVGE